MPAFNFTFRATEVDAQNRVPPLQIFAPRGMLLGGGALVPRLLTREEPVYGLELEPFRWTYLRNQARSGDPARQGLLRTIGWMYLFKTAGVRNWARFVERHGMPFVVAKVDENAWQTDRDKIKNVIRSFGPDGGAVFSRAVELQLLEASKSGAECYEKLCHYFGDAATKVILGQTLTTGTPHEGQSGSRSQGQTHQLVRQDILESDCKATSEMIQRDIIRPLVGFKFGWDEPVPTHQFKYEPAQDMVERATVTKTLSDAGWVRDQEEMEQEFKMKLTRGDPAPKIQENVDLRSTAALSQTLPEMHSHRHGATALDGIVAAALPKLASREVLEPMFGPVRTAIDRALKHSATVEEFRAALATLLDEVPGLLPKMNVHAFADELNRAMIAAAKQGKQGVRRA